jgi:hypothetical protein
MVAGLSFHTLKILLSMLLSVLFLLLQKRVDVVLPLPRIKKATEQNGSLVFLFAYQLKYVSYKHYRDTLEF